MIQDFQELSDKIDQLAELAQTLRRENAQLRHSHAALIAEHLDYRTRLAEAEARVTALLEKIPAVGADRAPEPEDAQ